MRKSLDWTNFNEFFAESKDIPLPPRKPLAEKVAAERRAAYETFSRSREQNSYDRTHFLRFQRTVEFYWDEIGNSKHIVELGGLSRIGLFAEKYLSKELTQYERDLRDQFDLPDNHFDCVLCLEVAEHLKDNKQSEGDIEGIAQFNYSGIINLFAESYRVLTKGGVLALTTPNAISLDSILNAMTGRCSFIYELHVRELTPTQVKAFGSAVGFTLERFDTYDCYQLHSEAARKMAAELIKKLGSDVERRDNGAFYLFRKN
jgi:SAM-dependent methyltransferase